MRFRGHWQRNTVRYHVLHSHWKPDSTCGHIKNCCYRNFAIHKRELRNHLLSCDGIRQHNCGYHTAVCLKSNLVTRRQWTWWLNATRPCVVSLDMEANIALVATFTSSLSSTQGCTSHAYLLSKLLLVQSNENPSFHRQCFVHWVNCLQWSILITCVWAENSILSVITEVFCDGQPWLKHWKAFMQPCLKRCKAFISCIYLTKILKSYNLMFKMSLIK